MSTRKLLLLNLSQPLPELSGALRARGWDIKVVSTIEELAEGNASSRCLIGLVILDEDAPQARIEKLPLLSPVEWMALVPAHLLEDADWAAVLANSFYDYHTLPLDIERLSTILGHAHGRCQLQRRLRTEHDIAGRFGMIGQSAPMQEMYARLDRITKVDAPVLIAGESGTGKELVASAIHKHSERGNAPFIPVNCGGLSESLIQSELFGHERGAFTGAHQRKIGSIEAAAGGVVFLDEIGDLPLSLQANLLRFLQEKTIVRLGSTLPTAVDVRVVAATHVDLFKAVGQGRFREDLFYRLNVVRIDVPALRQRGEDIELLAQAFFDSLGRLRNPRVRGFSTHAFDAMRQHHWPGNVRELVNRVQQAMIMGNNRLITPDDLDLLEISERSNVVPLSSARQRFEREMIRVALETNRQNVSRTARALGVSRVTLYRLFEKFAIERS